MIKLKRVARLILWAAYCILFLLLLLAQVYFQTTGSAITVSSIIYWLILIGWVGLILNFKWQSSASLYPAFVLFVIAAVLTVIDLRNLGETVMRISFIGWLVGIVQALVEYRPKNENSS